MSEESGTDTFRFHRMDRRLLVVLAPGYALLLAVVLGVVATDAASDAFKAAALSCGAVALLALALLFRFCGREIRMQVDDSALSIAGKRSARKIALDDIHSIELNMPLPNMLSLRKASGGMLYALLPQGDPPTLAALLAALRARRHFALAGEFAAFGGKIVRQEYVRQ